MAAFKLNPAPVFVADVAITVPGMDKPAPLSFNFKHKGRKALQAWIDAAAGKQDREFLGEVIDTWRGVEDAEGRPVAYSTDALDALLDAYPAAGAEIFNGYVKALTEAREKN